MNVFEILNRMRGLLPAVEHPSEILRLLLEVARDPGTFADLRGRCGMEPARLQRLLAFLEMAGILRKKGGRYALRPATAASRASEPPIRVIRADEEADPMDPDEFETMLHEAWGPQVCDAAADSPPRAAATSAPFDDAESAFRKRVVATFFRKGGLRELPARWKRRRVVLEAYAGSFATGRAYAEPEVNRIILAWGGDYCVIRKALCAEGFLAREAGVYRRIREADADLHAMASRRVHLGEAPSIRLPPRIPKPPVKPARPAVLALQNERENRIHVEFAPDAREGRLRLRALLREGRHPCAALQSDWDRLGEPAFSLVLLEALPKGIHPTAAHARDYAGRALRWREGFAKAGTLYGPGEAAEDP